MSNIHAKAAKNAGVAQNVSEEIEQAHTISAQVVEDNAHVRTNAEELMNLANNLTKIVESLNLSQRQSSR
jgi:hypothetical protein